MQMNIYPPTLASLIVSCDAEAIKLGLHELEN